LKYIIGALIAMMALSFVVPGLAAEAYLPPYQSETIDQLYAQDIAYLLDMPAEMVYYADYGVYVVNKEGLSQDVQVQFANAVFKRFEEVKGVYFVDGTMVRPDLSVENIGIVDLSKPTSVARAFF
jgi:hypothetical protein